MHPMNHDPAVHEAAEAFQQIMLDVLQRRAIEEALEERAVGKVAADESTLRMYAADYVGSQLADLRKFFDTGGRAPKIKPLTALLPAGSKSQTRVILVALRAYWRK